MLPEGTPSLGSSILPKNLSSGLKDSDSSNEVHAFLQGCLRAFCCTWHQEARLQGLLWLVQD